MRTHDLVRSVDKLVVAAPDYMILHEEQVDSRLRVMHSNLISLWNVHGRDGAAQPVVSIVSGTFSKTASIYVEVWSISARQHRHAVQDEQPTYNKPIDVAMREVIAVSRARSYVRIVVRDLTQPIKVRLRLNIVVDQRRPRGTWHHVRNQEALREGGLKPGETRLLTRF